MVTVDSLQERRCDHKDRVPPTAPHRCRRGHLHTGSAVVLTQSPTLLPGDGLRELGPTQLERLCRRWQTPARAVWLSDAAELGQGDGRGAPRPGTGQALHPLGSEVTSRPESRAGRDGVRSPRPSPAHGTFTPHPRGSGQRGAHAHPCPHQGHRRPSPSLLLGTGR